MTTVIIVIAIMLVYGMAMFVLGVWAGEQKAALLLEEKFPRREP